MVTVVKNPARNAEIVRLRGEGLTPAQITARLALSRNIVLGVLYRAGLTDKHSPKAACAAYDPAFRALVLASREQNGFCETVRRWGVPDSTLAAWGRGL